METALYSISQIRSLEKIAIEKFHLSEFTLMNRAGKATWDYLRMIWPNAEEIVVICGQGNNGGDGFILAKCAKLCGVNVSVRTLGDVAHYSPASLEAFKACQSMAINIYPFNASEQWSADLLVDAILGIGLNKAVTGSIKEAITCLNDSSLPILAIDVPSGLNADTGCVMGVAVEAHHTISFIGLKRGLFTHEAVDFTGTVRLDQLDLPCELFQGIEPEAYKLSSDVIKNCFRPRRRNSHKGDFGHVVILGGNKGMAGAARLAAEAALRVGAGLVTVATLPEHQALIPVHYPEIMCHGVTNATQLEALLARATTIILGPGLGKDDWGQMMMTAALSYSLPTVIDADGLNLLGPFPQCSDNWLLSPHPGEASRLLACTVGEIQQDRFQSITMLAKLGGTWILKGAGSLIKKGADCFLCPYGNPGMASGGMGDALSGILGGLMAQKLSCLEAARAGVLIHALAGDQAAYEQGVRGLVASDIVERIKHWINFPS